MQCAGALATAAAGSLLVALPLFTRMFASPSIFAQSGVALACLHGLKLLDEQYAIAILIGGAKPLLGRLLDLSDYHGGLLPPFIAA